MSNQHISNAFDKIRVSCDDIFSIQQRLASYTWNKEQVMSSWNMEIAGHCLFIVKGDNRISLMKIYNAPSELLDSVIIGGIYAYGSVLSFRRNLAADNIFKGIRTAWMKIEKSLSSTTRIVGEFIRLWNAGQPKTCKHCGDLGHLMKDCISVHCFSCEKAGHRAEDCEEPDTCSICRSYNHRESHCPYLVSSSNIESEILEYVSWPNSYAGAAKSPCVVARRVAFVFFFLLQSLTPTRNEMEKGNQLKEEGRKIGLSLLKKRERDHMKTISMGVSGASVMAEASPGNGTLSMTGTVIMSMVQDRSCHHQHQRSRDEDHHRSGRARRRH